MLQWIGRVYSHCDNEVVPIAVSVIQTDAAVIIRIVVIKITMITRTNVTT